MNKTLKDLLRGYDHLPFVCQYFQQAEAVRLALVLAKK